MNFLSFNFLAVFLPVLFLLYWAVRDYRAQNIVMLAASVLFYALFSVKYLIFLAAVIVITYLGGVLSDKVKKPKAVITACAVLEILMLAVFKYTGFALESINTVIARFMPSAVLKIPDLLLPIGLSFIIFQSLTYLFDLLKGKQEAEYNFINIALFISFFPTVTSGPIQKSREFLPKIRSKRTLSFEKFEKVLFVFLWGAFIKTVISDRLALYTDAIYSNLEEYSGFYILICAVAYSIQIYADFAAYSYMATALAGLFGFELKENFRRPYLALNIADFWRRWHISLTSWLTEYVYIPLGGNRKGKVRRYVNIAAVFLISGLWHGAGWTFVVWGALHAVFQIIGHLTREKRSALYSKLGVNTEKAEFRLLQRGFVLVITTFAWIFFRSESLTQAGEFISRMFAQFNPWVLFDGSLLLGKSHSEFTVTIIALAVFLLASVFCEKGKNAQTVVKCNAVLKIFIFWALLFSVVIFGIYGGEYQASNFIYAGF